MRCLMACVAWLACTSPQLEAGPTHPASTEAPAAPLTPVGGALDPNFEPEPALPSGAAPAHAEHRQASPAAAAPTSSAAAPAPAAHGEHQHAPAAEKQAPPAATRYTCPMHPEIIRNEPGNCPICGMKLKPITPKDGVKGSQ